MEQSSVGGALYWLLRNPVYIGQVVHKGQRYEGRQEAIVERSLWERVQVLLSAKSQTRGPRPIASGGRPLAGRLFDDLGNAMSPSFTIKRNGRRYRYYVSQALLRNEKGRVGSIARVQAEAIERLVRTAVMPRSENPEAFAEVVRQQIERVVVHADRVEIVKVPSVVDGSAADEDAEILVGRTIVVPAKLARHGRALILDDGAAGPDPALLRALGRAHDWRGWLERGEALSYRAIAAKAGVTSSYVQTVLPLAFLAPRLTRELLDGRRRVRGGLMARLRRGIPADWSQQLNSL